MLDEALALGARAVLMGRPVFWGLAVEGETGVRMVLEMLRDELEATMGMCGCTTVASVDRECLVGSPPYGRCCPRSPRSASGGYAL
jgi:4-hydroxymandelate oxidase